MPCARGCCMRAAAWGHAAYSMGEVLGFPEGFGSHPEGRLWVDAARDYRWPASAGAAPGESSRRATLRPQRLQKSSPRRPSKRVRRATRRRNREPGPLGSTRMAARPCASTQSTNQSGAGPTGGNSISKMNPQFIPAAMRESSGATASQFTWPCTGSVHRASGHILGMERSSNVPRVVPSRNESEAARQRTCHAPPSSPHL